MPREKERIDRRAMVRVVCYVVCAVVVLYALVPRTARFQYEFQKGKVWTYPSLKAPYDYPLYLTPQEVQAQRAEIADKVWPVFRIEPLVEEEVADALEAYIDTLYWPGGSGGQRAPSGWRHHGHPSRDSLFNDIRQLLTLVYTQGVVERADLHGHARNGRFAILREHISYEAQPRDVFTPHQVVKQLAATLQRHIPASLGVTLDTLYLKRVVRKNLQYDSSLTMQLRDEQLRTLSSAEGMVHAGEKIIDQGELVNEVNYQKLVSLEREFAARAKSGARQWGAEVANVFLLLLTFAGFCAFLYLHDMRVLANTKHFLFLVLVVVLEVSAAYLVIRFTPSLLYLVPCVAGIFLVKTFFDGRVAFVSHLVAILLVAMYASNSFEFFLLSLVSGSVAILTLQAIYRRAKLFLSVCYVLLSYVGTLALLVLLREGSLFELPLLTLVLFAGNAFLTLAVYPLMYPLEKLFNFLSATTLMELSDVTQPLLRKLAEKAPGTFQHSLQVANLAEEAAIAIGADPLLVRVGALYHDIGKMETPEYFTENQSPNSNPHNHLTELESAKLIIAHVSNGMKIARSYGLPAPVCDFIVTHHGTRRAEYFYRRYRAAHMEEPDIPEQFTYPGPKPFSKETVVLMMADSVEAASRSLEHFTKEDLQVLVENIVNYQQMDDQYDESNVSFHDIATIKRIFINKLLNIYHTRIAYPPDPNVEKPAEQAKATQG